jgi:hypothetical protein
MNKIVHKKSKGRIITIKRQKIPIKSKGFIKNILKKLFKK